MRPLSRYAFVFVLFVAAFSKPEVSLANEATTGPDGQTVECRAMIVKATSTRIWRNYKCKSCASIASSKPVDGRQACMNCGSPHKGEPFIELKQEQIRKRNQLGGYDIFLKVYVPVAGLIADGEKGSEFAGTGDKWKCPFCTATNFSIDTRCSGCGAELTNDEARLGFEASTRSATSTRGASSTRSSASQSSSASERLERSQSFAPDLSSRWSPQTVRRIWYGVAAAGALAVSILVPYSRQPLTVEGEITNVTGSLVTITPTHDRNTSLQFEWPAAETEAGSITEPRVGQQVEIHRRRWFAPVGAETSRGEVLLPR